MSSETIPVSRDEVCDAFELWLERMDDDAPQVTKQTDPGDLADTLWEYLHELR